MGLHHQCSLLLLDHLSFPGRLIARTGFQVEVQSCEVFDVRERIWRDTSDLIVQLAAMFSSPDNQHIGLAGMAMHGVSENTLFDIQYPTHSNETHSLQRKQVCSHRDSDLIISDYPSTTPRQPYYLHTTIAARADRLTRPLQRSSNLASHTRRLYHTS